MSDTKEKILETAERLFAEQGYAATSLRHIIADAGVNLAAIHYHYGSKEDLLDHVIARKATPVNEARLALLDRFEAEASPEPPPVEKVLEAFLQPMAGVAAGSPQFIRVMGRMHAEGLVPAIIQKHFQPSVVRFRAALRRALPDLPERELYWRIHFMIGAMAHAVCGRPAFPFEGCAEEGIGTRLTRLTAFLSAAFRAPVSAAEEQEVER